jgi:hypothetical protein
MSVLRDSYDLQGALNTGFDAGVAFVAPASSAYLALQSALASASAMGKEVFTVSIPTTHATASLRLNGKYLKAYFAGIISGLALEDIYSYEVSLTLDTSDTLTTNVIFNFTF